ncbi:MAG: hypothetical protein IK055_01355 [Lachnospiraceae bacterium]|nr:hypothetical protein [Lachnospiraceae bacterium]
MNHKSVYPFFPSSFFSDNLENTDEVMTKEDNFCEQRSDKALKELRSFYQFHLKKQSDYSLLKHQSAVAIQILEMATEDVDHFESTINTIYSNVTTYIGSLFSVMALLFGGGLLFGSLSNTSIQYLLLFGLTIVIGGIIFYCKNHTFNEYKVAQREVYRNAIICFTVFSDCLSEYLPS